MPVTVSLTEAQVFEATGNVLTVILPTSVEIMRGQVNRTPPPDAADYVMMNTTLRQRLSTNRENWDTVAQSPTFISALTATDATVQCDVHGPNAADNAQIIATLMRSPYGCDLFTTEGFDIQPLYVVDPRQVPFLDGEQQVEDRWVVDVHLQLNPVIQAPQDFAAALTISTLEVEVQTPIDASGGELNFEDPDMSGLQPGI